MTAAHRDGATGAASNDGVGASVALPVADWLRLAAAPTFAIMALLTGVLGSDAADMLCSAAGPASPLTGMTAMYALMCVFHLPSWLRLISGRGSNTGRE